MSFEIISLEEKHLEEAAALVCRRYVALRAQVPFLPSKYEHISVIYPMLEALPRDCPGVVALRGSRLVGFMTGFVLPGFMGRRCVYSPEWANGAELEGSRRIYEEMYERLSAQWIADGCYGHILSLMVNDRQAIECWHWLGFGLIVVDGMRTLEPVRAPANQVEISRAGPQDAAEAAACIRALEEHVASAPTFFIHELDDSQTWLEDPRKALWLARHGGQTLGCLGIGPANEDACVILQDEKTAGITAAFTWRDARSQGVATALLNRALEWARSQGYERCAVDFEAMNFLATRFWMKWFEPVCYSMMRCIDERVGAARE